MVDGGVLVDARPIR